MSEDMSEIMSKDRSERMAKDMSERYVRRYVIRKSVKRFVRKNGKRYVRKMSERMSEDMSERMSEDMSGRTSENMSQVYVHTQIWITRIHVCTNGILWLASCFLFYLAYCSKYCWLNFVFVQGSEFGLEAMAEVVVERPETIFIGTANQVAKGVEHVWRDKLTFVGAERMYVCMGPPSTTHARDLMFIMEEVVEGNKWYVAYEGRPVPNAEGEQELEKRAAVFRTSASFWEMNGRQTTCGAGPPMQNRRKHRSGEHLTSWFAHAMRCSCGTSNSFAFLDSTAFWRGGLMHVVCVCVWNYRRFASLDLTAFWRGGPMHWGRWHLQAQSCHGYYFCCVVRGKYRVCRAAFFVKLWMLGFGFDMSERMSEDMSESMSKDMSERMSEDMSERVSKDVSERMSKDMSERCQKECQKECQKIYQKICQKECQKICQKERQKIASSQSAKLRVTEHISGDELYVYPHLTWSGWHKSDGCGSLSE